MTKSKHSSALLLALTALTVLAISRPAFAQAPAGDAAKGRQLYYDHGCYGCHGFNGETGARDLVATGSPILADEATFRLFLRLRADQAPVLPSTRMPNYPAETLDDAQVRDLYAFVRSFRPNAPAVADTPALRRILEAARAQRNPAIKDRSREGMQ